MAVHKTCIGALAVGSNLLDDLSVLTAGILISHGDMVLSKPREGRRAQISSKFSGCSNNLNMDEGFSRKIPIFIRIRNTSRHLRDSEYI
jgi:hypothetical protein